MGTEYWCLYYRFDREKYLESFPSRYDIETVGDLHNLLRVLGLPVEAK
jgi:hypothetical protein